MTRKEFLRSMLKSIFTVITLSLDGDKINKGTNNSLYHNCNYTVGSYKDFKRLFEVAFISDSPKWLDDTVFNQQDVIDRANKYLYKHNIYIPDYLNEKEQRMLIYTIFTRYLLKVIIIDYDNKKKEASSEDDITDDFFTAIRCVQYDLGLNYNKRSVEMSINNYERYTQITDNAFSTESDKCNLSIEFDMSYLEECQVLGCLRGIQIVIPGKSDKTKKYPSVKQSNTVPLLILSGYFNSNDETTKEPQCYPANFFQDSNDLFINTHYVFTTYTAEADIIKNIKGNSLGRIVENYQYELLKKAEEQLKPQTITALRPLYENNRTYLEHMINVIVLFNKKTRILLKNTRRQVTMKLQSRFCMTKVIKRFGIMRCLI